ncbi:hypothetical protein J2S03_003382 [Alicyclobacillus cycloheptanicus]|uniref:Uncharacterized protein n=1 Tax=Alicyclobacillus cycloheptanicus TaxID=1457 RepID=A0ABT9XMG5_9BACL|nr:hypothetical protein [Alicyclobacillus cycloheptanicus]
MEPNAWLELKISPVISRLFGILPTSARLRGMWDNRTGSSPVLDTIQWRKAKQDRESREFDGEVPFFVSGAKIGAHVIVECVVVLVHGAGAGETEIY